MILEAITPLESLIDSLKSERRAIFLYGMGNGAEKIYEYLSSRGIEIKGIVASEGFLRGQSFLGFDVCSISAAEERYGSLCLVLCFGLEGDKSHFLNDIRKKHRLVSPNLAVFGNEVCDKEFILANIEKFERVYEILSDELSKEIYLNLIKYNVTGDIDHLAYGNGLNPPEEFYNHKLRHIDVGAYDGDTVLEFASHNTAYSDIIAFEPDHMTYKKLVRNIQGIRNVTAENKAVCRHGGNITFASGGGRASHCDESGISIDCTSVDAYCGYTHIAANGIPVGSIKIDAEGMDEDVICGAVNTIYCCKCNVGVALYHRAEDIIELPLLLRKHNNKYKFYLRKKEYVPAWDVFLYAIDTSSEG